MLHYESTRQVRPGDARAILSEIGMIRREWWRGVLGLDAEAVDRPSVLAGRTPLFHPHGIPDADDLFMAFADAAFILGNLSRWARRYRIKWRIRMNDEDWGAVDPSGMTPPLREEMEKWALRVGLSPSTRGTWAIPEDRRSELLARHAGRKTT